MGIPLTIFTLHRFAAANCAHYLLVRVQQLAFRNADAADFLRAAVAADAKRDALVRAYHEDVLPRECADSHSVRLVGELQSYPVGDELVDGPGGRFVDLWVAETKYGAPWVVMGTAADEDAFWRAVEADEDLASLGPIRPAVKRRAWLLVDEDAGAASPDPAPAS